MKKKLITLMLAIVLCFAMCPAVHAANGDLSVSALNVTFTNDTVIANTDDGGTNTAYFSYAQLPDNTNFSSVNTTFTFTGTALKINGTQVSTTSPYTYYGLNLGTLATVEVVYSGGSRVHYISAYPSSFDVTMQFEYSNAVAFANLSGSTYGTSSYVTGVTSTQKTAMAGYVSQMDAMCDSMLPSITREGYKRRENITITVNPQVPSSNTPYGLMQLFKNARTNFVFSGSTSYINSIGYLDYNSTGHYSGGWMYQVVRGNVTYTPSIGIDGWKLLPGDEVIWRYTCDYGYDIGAPMW